MWTQGGLVRIRPVVRGKENGVTSKLSKAKPAMEGEEEDYAVKKPTIKTKETLSEYRHWMQHRLRARVVEAIELVMEEKWTWRWVVDRPGPHLDQNVLGQLRRGNLSLDSEPLGRPLFRCLQGPRSEPAPLFGANVALENRD